MSIPTIASTQPGARPPLPTPPELHAFSQKRYIDISNWPIEHEARFYQVGREVYFCPNVKAENEIWYHALVYERISRVSQIIRDTIRTKDFMCLLVQWGAGKQPPEHQDDHLAGIVNYRASFVNASCPIHPFQWSLTHTLPNTSQISISSSLPTSSNVQPEIVQAPKAETDPGAGSYYAIDGSAEKYGFTCTLGPCIPLWLSSQCPPSHNPVASTSSVPTPVPLTPMH